MILELLFNHNKECQWTWNLKNLNSNKNETYTPYKNFNPNTFNGSI